MGSLKNIVISNNQKNKLALKKSIRNKSRNKKALIDGNTSESNLNSSAQDEKSYFAGTSYTSSMHNLHKLKKQR